MLTNKTFNDLNITYLLGAGASYRALPIWKAQAQSMINVARCVLEKIRENLHYQNTDSLNADREILNNTDYLRTFFKDLELFGEKAKEFGSIDIYAKRLFLLRHKEELNRLKKCVSVYFDLWENNLVHKSENNETIFSSTEPMNRDFDKIDKRYYSLLSVLLERETDTLKLNDQVNFISWNYDLQLEKAYESFLLQETESLEELMNCLCKNENPKMIHLNGNRGQFYCNKECYETVPKKKCATLESYLNIFASNEDQFKGYTQNYNSSIKYAWEGNSEVVSDAIQRMKETNVLIVIGYSFPAFNRAVDCELINAFEGNGRSDKSIILQDPNPNNDLIQHLFKDKNKVKQIKNTEQLYLPHEFLTPS